MYRMLRGVAAGLLLACSGRPEAAQTYPVPRDSRGEADPRPNVEGVCDPLIANDVEIQLAQPVAVGRDLNRMLFVVDAVGGIDMRSFRSVPGREVLERQSPVGLSEESDQQYIWDVFYVGEERPLLVRVDREAWLAGFLGPRHFGMWIVAPSDGRLSGPEMARLGEPLEVLPPQAVSGWEIHNYPQRIAISYLAETEDGRWLLVTRAEGLPENDEHVRVYFGPAEAVQQRRLVSFGRALDGGSASIKFDVLGRVARASFFAQCGGVAGAFDCPAKLSLDTGELSLRKHHPSEGIPAELRVVCGTP